jgi:outer membrane protein assembly factor BamE
MRPSSRPALRRPSNVVRHSVLLLAACAALFASGCVYRMPIQQGNFLDPEQVDQLQTGMTRTQVAFLLGTPMVPPSFNNDRWDYYYYLKGRPLKSPVTRRLIVLFENDKVSSFDRSQMPGSPSPVMTNPG